MSKIKSLIAVLVVAGGGYAAYHFQQIKSYVVPACTQPITYKIGSFDNQFHISQDQFKKAIDQAAQIWDKAAGKQLFQYSDSGSMPVNLIYDSRQESSDQLKKLGLSIDTTQASYDQLKKQYDLDQAQYRILKSQFDQMQGQYNADKQAYESQIAALHGRPVPQSEFNQLEAQREHVNAEAAALNNFQDQINKLVDTVNALATTLNRIGSQLNQDVSAYNTTGSNLGEFQEGLFTSNGLNKEVDIYEFDNYDMLVRVLAHELGHSVGMEHVDDLNAIMYRLNQSKNEKPTQADIAELDRVCGIKTAGK